MADLNYAAVYSQALADSFPSALHFGAIYATPNNGRYRFSGGKSIELPSLEVGGRVDADRDSVDTITRNFDNSWDVKTLANQRCWSTLVHPRDIDETDMAASIANITSVYNNEQKFPEMDAYTVSKLYSEFLTYGGQPVCRDIDSTNVLTTFDSLMQSMSEALVPASGRVLYVTPPVMTALKSVSGISRSFDVHSSGESGLNRAVTMLDGVAVVEVPSVLMKTGYDFTEGWSAASDAYQINMLLVHPESVITPVSYQFARLDPPSAVTGGKYAYYEESFEDVFILAKRAAGVAFVVDYIAATGVELNKSTLSLSGTNSEKLIATVTPGNANDVLEWTSSDTTKATAAPDGTVTAVAAGSATITVAAGTGITDTCAVTVTN